MNSLWFHSTSFIISFQESMVRIRGGESLCVHTNTQIPYIQWAAKWSRVPLHSQGGKKEFMLFYFFFANRIMAIVMKRREKKGMNSPSYRTKCRIVWTCSFFFLSLSVILFLFFWNLYTWRFSNRMWQGTGKVLEHCRNRSKKGWKTSTIMDRLDGPHGDLSFLARCVYAYVYLSLIFPTIEFLCAPVKKEKD